MRGKKYFQLLFEMPNIKDRRITPSGSKRFRSALSVLRILKIKYLFDPVKFAQIKSRLGGQDSKKLKNNNI